MIFIIYKLKSMGKVTDKDIKQIINPFEANLQVMIITNKAVL